jgi:hypothetical protein
VHEAVSLIADWGGQDLGVGISIVPVRWVPLVITPVMADVLGLKDHKRAFAIGVGLGFKFSQIRNIFQPRS